MSSVRNSVVDTVTQNKISAALHVYLKPSSHPLRKSAFFFPRMRDTDETVLQSHEGLVQVESLGSATPLFCILSSSCEYYALRLPLLKAGFKRISAADTVCTPPNLIWGRSIPFREITHPETGERRYQIATPTSPEQTVNYEALKMPHPFQRFNHFPLSHRNIGCKRGLGMNLRRLETFIEAQTFSKAETMERFDFVPKTWFYPREKDLLIEEFKKASPKKMYIWKPARGSCGRGICITHGGVERQPVWERLMAEIETRKSDVTGRPLKEYVVQEYLDNPLLLDGRKMDLRLYVCVTSYDPLVIYLHEEGLVRLAATSYGGEGGAQDILNKDRFKYLTNYSIGRKYKSTEQQTVESAVGATDAQVVSDPPEGSVPDVELKWDLPRFYRFITDHHGAAALEKLRKDIALVINRTMMATKPIISAALRRVDTVGSFVELYGFDIMIDAHLKPYLVEVNTLPSLESSSPFDYSTKTNVVSDLLNLAQLRPFERDIDRLGLICEDKNVLRVPPPACMDHVYSLEQQNSMVWQQLSDQENNAYRLQDELDTSEGV
ncbi:tubulin-tyrosine ligase-like protein [Angomonas deanei]|uniref:Tubulin-tyrosine ligase family, putative n=1 Tax=Angomonas deanei TaxID=59799 RepID=A0A7G2CET8_9TRYP|nr:tubulin-tyrosine ligase-like protein [Angomonas deanei]CAD2218049.1 Tubulin-tyrosine ligase family, putative [Angomonas deanei]|eukprot:EPY35344.1 tubulin-tyrosine ligase-like protein [Angomonas deanei]